MGICCEELQDWVTVLICISDATCC